MVPVLERPERVEAHAMAFLHGTDLAAEPRPGARLVGDVPEKIRFTRRAIPFDDVDAAVADIAQHFGHQVDQIASITFTLVLTAVNNERDQRPLRFTVRRDANGRTFTARCNIPGPWGHGATIGEALHECVADFSGRSQILMRERDRLCPALQREADEMERWTIVAE